MGWDGGAGVGTRQGQGQQRPDSGCPVVIYKRPGAAVGSTRTPLCPPGGGIDERLLLPQDPVGKGPPCWEWATISSGRSLRIQTALLTGRKTRKRYRLVRIRSTREAVLSALRHQHAESSPPDSKPRFAAE